MVDNADKFRAFAHPLRQEIIAATSEPKSVTDVADALGVPAARLYHHFKVLERHGVIEGCGTRRVRSNDERLYRRAAGTVRFAPSVIASREVRGQLREGLSQVAEDFMAEFTEATLAWEKGPATEEPFTVSRRAVELTEHEAREVAGRLAASLDDIFRRRRGKGDRRTWVHASFFFPQAEQ